MDYLSLCIKGEIWAAYPKGLSFPRMFAHFFPSRGSGRVSKVLYLLNKIRLDRFILPSRENLEQLDCLKSFKYDYGNLAFFWPSPHRSAGRFYAYKLGAGKKPRIEEYFKIATSEEEKMRLECEAQNNIVASRLSNGVFKVPTYLGKDESVSASVFRYEALPEDADDIKCSALTLTIVAKAYERIRNAGYQHRDFTMHNCKTVGNNLWVLDWENMAALSDTVPRLMDEISFWLCKEYYYERKNPVEIAASFRVRYLGSAGNVGNEAYDSLKALANDNFFLANEVFPYLKKL